MLRGLGGSFVEYVLHPIDTLQRMKRVAPKTKGNRPRSSHDEVQLRVIGAFFRAVREPVPSLALGTARSRFLDRLAGEELSLATLDRLAGLSVHHLYRVMDVLAGVWRRIVWLDDVGIARR